VHALHEGDAISPWETVMTIEATTHCSPHLETVYLGSLARRSLIMRNVDAVVRQRAASQSSTSPRATTTGMCRPATAGRRMWPRDRRLHRRAGLLVGGRGVGTVPHGLIAAYGGDTVRAAQVFAERFHEEMNITVLVDFGERLRAHCGRRGDGARSKLWACGSIPPSRWSTAP